MISQKYQVYAKRRTGNGGQHIHKKVEAQQGQGTRCKRDNADGESPAQRVLDCSSLAIGFTLQADFLFLLRFSAMQTPS